MRLTRPFALASILGFVVIAACVGDEPSTENGNDGGGGGDAQNGGDGGSGGDAACAPNCGSACVDLTSNKDNCGACGHSCLGASCTGSKCDAVQVFVGSATDAATAGVAGIGVDGSNVFWITPRPSHPGAQSISQSSTVYECATSGACSVPQIYFQQVAEVDSMIGGGPGVFYLANQSGALVERLSTNGIDAGSPVGTTCGKGNPCELGTGIAYPAYLATDGTRVFAGSNADGTHGSGLEATDGGLSYLVLNAASGVGITAVTADATNNFVYSAFTNGNIYISRGTDTNATPTNTITSQTVVGQMMVANGKIFWTRPDTGDVVTIPACLGVADCGNGNPAPTTSVFANAPGAFAITSDSTHAYWSAGSDVYACPLTGCGGSPTKIASGSASIHAIANDAASVYWGDDSGSIWKVAK